MISKVIIPIIYIFSMSCALPKQSSKIENDVCSYLNKPIKSLMTDISEQVKDTSKIFFHYTGEIVGLRLYLKNKKIIEIWPHVPSDDKLLKNSLNTENFQYQTIQNLPIWRIKYYDKHRIIDECMSK